MTIYYVSGTGSDSANGLTTGTAKRTLQAVHALMVAGDTCKVMNGDYTDPYTGTAVLEITTSGSAGSPITYEKYTGHSPRIIVASNNWQGIFIKANYITIDGIEVYGNAENITYAYAYSERNNDNNSSTSADGIAIDGRTVGTRRNIIVRNCIVHHMPGGGISAIAADYVTIEDNRVYSCAWWTPYANSGISAYSIRHVDSDTSIYKINIRRNKCYDNENFIGFIYAAGEITDGNGIIVDDNLNEQSTNVPYVGKTLVTNNLCFNNGGSGVHAYNSANVDLINNTAWNNSRSPLLDNGEIFSNSGQTVNIHNNIMYARTGKKATTNNNNSGVSYNYNLYYNGTVAVTGANDLTGDPLFISPSTTFSLANFRPSPTSPAKANGTATLAPTDDIEGISRNGVIDRGAYIILAGIGATGSGVIYRRRKRK